MTCWKCGSENVRIDFITGLKTSYSPVFYGIGGALGWLIAIILTILSCGLFLIVFLLTELISVFQSRKVGICQKCGSVIEMQDDETINFMQQWWVWLVAVIVLVSIVGCLTNKDPSKSITKQKKEETSVSNQIKENFSL